MKLRMLNSKKGILGLDTAKDFILVLLTIAVIAFASVIALATLRNSNVLDADKLEYNYSQDILLNVSSGTSSFFANTGTWFALLSVVIIILIIAVVIMAVNRFGGGGGGGL